MNAMLVQEGATDLADHIRVIDKRHRDASRNTSHLDLTESCVVQLIAVDVVSKCEHNHLLFICPPDH